MKNNQVVYRQGDVLIRKINKVPDSVVKSEGTVTLARGEVTGHAHTISNSHTIAFSNANSTDPALADFISILDESAELTHQEHDTIKLPQGDYEIIRQTEYDPMTKRRNVAD